MDIKIQKIQDKIEYDNLEAQGCLDDCVTYNYSNTTSIGVTNVDHTGCAAISLCACTSTSTPEYSASFTTLL